MKMIYKLSYLPFFLAFINYDYFPFVAVIFIILQHKGILKTIYSKSLLKVLFLIFLLLRFLSSLDSRLESIWVLLSQKNYALSGKFIDLQSVFWGLNCNAVDSAEYALIGMEQTMSCPHSVSYGPLFEVIGIKNNPAVTTFIFAFLVLMLIYLYYVQISKSLNNGNLYIFTLFLMSPPLNFVIERMNFDIFIFISIYLIYKNLNNSFIKNSLIFVLALLKYYPIFLIIGSLLFNISNKRYKNIKNDLLFLILPVFVYIYIESQNFVLNQPVRPFRPDRTFGLLSEALNLNNAFGYDTVKLYVVLVMLLVLISFITLKNFKYSGLFEKEFTHNLLIMFLLFSLFANYDYRLAFMVLMFPLLIVSENKVLFYSYVFFIFSSPGIMHSYGNLAQLIENYFIVYLDIPFYFLLANLIIEYVRYIKVKFKQN